MNTKEYRIPAGDEVLACSVDYAHADPPPSVITLHGGGPSDRHSTEYLARHLQNAGRTVIRFDFSGQGESTGTMADSSLKKRVEETESVLSYFGLNGIPFVIGSSMGGYIASAVASRVDVERLVLFCPAAYSVDAWDVPFESGFTEIIRAPDSFLHSDITDLLALFCGDTLLIMGERDEIIPDAVVAMYKNALTARGGVEFVEIAECPHPIHRWAAHRPEVRRDLTARVATFLA